MQKCAREVYLCPNLAQRAALLECGNSLPLSRACWQCRGLPSNGDNQPLYRGKAAKYRRSPKRLCLVQSRAFINNGRAPSPRRVQRRSSSCSLCKNVPQGIRHLVHQRKGQVFANIWRDLREVLFIFAREDDEAQACPVRREHLFFDAAGRQPAFAWARIRRRAAGRSKWRRDSLRESIQLPTPD